MNPLIESARTVVERHSAKVLDNETGAITTHDPCDDLDGVEEVVLLDAFSAGMVCQVWDALSERSRERWPELIRRLGCAEFVCRLWELVGKVNG